MVDIEQSGFLHQHSRPKASTPTVVLAIEFLVIAASWPTSHILSRILLFYLYINIYESMFTNKKRKAGHPAFLV